MKRVIKHLRDLENGEVEPSGRSHGVCFELECKFYILPNILNHCFDEWPMTTGEYRDKCCYPVPHPTKDPVAAYGERDLWIGEYGDNRRALCLWFADYLEENGISLLESNNA